MNYYTIYMVYGRIIPELGGIFFPCFHTLYPYLFLGFCPFRAQGGLRLYPGCYPGLGASALSGRAASRSFWAFSPYLNHMWN